MLLQHSVPVKPAADAKSCKAALDAVRASAAAKVVAGPSAMAGTVSPTRIRSSAAYESWGATPLGILTDDLERRRLVFGDEDNMVRAKLEKDMKKSGAQTSAKAYVSEIRDFSV